MSFISYAQNFEDVMLWRALQQVDQGFYIDVGANDPVVDSVTKALYDRGWHGVNLEPVPRYYHDLARQRPNDINLQQAAGAAPGSFTLYEVETVRGWGTLDANMAEQYRRQGYSVLEIPVFVTTLSDICQRYVTGEIHVLKIDVEGVEEQVLRGMDFSRWHPWIVIAESRVPTEQGPITADWEPLLLEQGYTFAYFDGVNSFYLADEHKAELQQAFSAPPNALDDFVRHSEWQAGRYAEELEVKIRQEQQALQQLRQHCSELEQHWTQHCDRLEQHCAGLTKHCAGLEQQIAALYASSSWKITAPLRKVLGRLRKKNKKGLLPVADMAVGTGEAALPLSVCPAPVTSDPLRVPLSAEARQIYDLLAWRKNS